MTDRIVVCFRAIELDVEPEEYLLAARALSERAAALGARLISWSATLYAFEFEPDAAPDAVELAISAVRSAPSTGALAVGMSEGPLESAEDATARQTLRWGYPLVRATALARAARSGEVLLDPAIRSVERGELVTTGVRVSLYGKLRIRGLVLNGAHPWRGSSVAVVQGFGRPPFIPRSELDEVVAALDGLTVVRGAPGSGATRLLEEVGQALEPARVLFVAPESLGEPLGALRRALIRSVTSNQAPAGLSSGPEQSLEGLLAGEGIDPDSGAELLSGWLSPDPTGGPPGVVLVDDANEVDADTLEVIGQAYARGPDSFRVIARLAPSESVPPGLSGIPLALEVELGSLSTEHGEELAGLSGGGSMDARTKAQWAVRGGSSPLSIVEAVRESIEANEIAWDEGSAVARAQSQTASGPRPAGFWIRRRFVRRDAASVRVLEALAVLGGHASESEIAAALEAHGDSVPDLAKVLSGLEASGWVSVDKPDRYALPSASHRDTIVRSMKDTAFAAWHRVAADAAARGDRPLAVASAAIHYVLAGDAERARSAARKGAAATRAIGLEATATGFDALSARDDFSALIARNLFGAEPRGPHAIRLERVSRPSTPSDSARGSRRPRGSARPSRPPAESADRSSDSPGGAPQSPGRALEALRRGDAASVERLARELRVDETRSGLAERLQAMADLARGDTGDAIRRLRDAVDEARRTKSRDQCRSLLALGVALAAASRNEEALLEVLDGLARAREAMDERGERACIRFLAQLATSAGHPDVGEEWASVAEG